MDNLSIGIIVGSTREGRLSVQPAHWIFDKVTRTPGVTAELIDLRDYPLPFYDEARTPKEIKDDYKNDTARAWLAKLKTIDAFIIVSPEYNHGYPGVLKNALDYAYFEWNNKPVGFVSYGTVGGGRVVEQLRLVAIELQMAPIRNAVHILSPWHLMDEQGKLKTESFDKQGDALIEQLVWWGTALKKARATA